MNESHPLHCLYPALSRLVRLLLRSSRSNVSLDGARVADLDAARLQPRLVRLRVLSRLVLKLASCRSPIVVRAPVLVQLVDVAEVVARAILAKEPRFQRQVLQ